MAHPIAARTQRGFTLVELMVVVSIIGILAAIGVPRVFAYVRASETAEASQTAGRILAGIRGYADSQLKPASVLAPEIDGKDLTVGGTGTDELTSLIPTLILAPESRFDYKIAAIEATSGLQSGEAAFCITATGRANSGVEGGIVLYSSAPTTAAGWDGSVNRIAYVNGDTTLTGVESGGYCDAAGAATATCTDCAGGT